MLGERVCGTLMLLLLSLGKRKMGLLSFSSMMRTVTVTVEVSCGLPRS